MICMSPGAQRKRLCDIDRKWDVPFVRTGSGAELYADTSVRGYKQ